MYERNTYVVHSGVLQSPLDSYTCTGSRRPRTCRCFDMATTHIRQHLFPLYKDFFHKHKTT